MTSDNYDGRRQPKCTTTKKQLGGQRHGLKSRAHCDDQRFVGDGCVFVSSRFAALAATVSSLFSNFRVSDLRRIHSFIIHFVALANIQMPQRPQQKQKTNSDDRRWPHRRPQKVRQTVNASNCAATTEWDRCGRGSAIMVSTKSRAQSHVAHWTLLVPAICAFRCAVLFHLMPARVRLEMVRFGP